jgi:NAD(P)-dependent dehydrogenase (short-subunit alcohol dehydrogenase family)
MLTAYFDDASDSAAARLEMEEVQPGKRIAHPREIAPTAVFLASDESAFINGTSIVVDGAMLARCY